MPIPVSIPRLGWNMEEGVFVEVGTAEQVLDDPTDARTRLFLSRLLPRVD